jgi:CSLREA domain-containing protein
MRTLLLTLACWLLLAGGTANAAIVSVTRADDPDPGACQPTDCSLREAIAAAQPDDTVLLMGDGQHTVVHKVTRGELPITKPLTLQGGGSSATGIDGLDNAGQRMVKVTSPGVRFADLTFQNAFQQSDEVPNQGGTPTLSHNGGGAIFSDGGQLMLDRVVFESNANVLIGGAVSSRNGTLTVTDSDFHAGRSSYGSAIFLRNTTATVERSTVRDGNNSRGAIFLESGSLALTNSTVTGNGQPSAAGGGVVNGGGTLTLLNDTLANNLRGSLMTYNNGAAVTNASNTLIGEGFGEACVISGVIGSPAETGVAITHDNGSNLAADASCGLTATSSHANALLRLAPIADNGGRTQTMALLWGNQAIDAGSGCPPDDQRAVQRQGTCDVGAFEAELNGVPAITTLAPPTQIEAYQATVAAQLDLIGEAGALRIDLGTSPNDLSLYTMIGVGRIAAPTQRSVELPGLSPDTTYYYQAIAFNATGAAVGETRSFTTGPAPPETYGAEVFDVTDTTASITAMVAPNGHPTTYVVKWTSANDSGQIGPFDAGSTDPVEVTKELTGLKPDTTYQVDVIATNVGGSSGLSSGPQELTTKRQLVARAGSTVTLKDTRAGCATSAFVNWGDETRDESATPVCDTDLMTLTATHTYPRAGRYHVLITYDSGETGDAWAQIAPVLATLSVTPVGPGRVTGAGIDCGEDCSETGDGTITLTATPEAGAVFDGWEGDCSGTGACTVSLDGDRSVTARFSTPQPQPQTSPTPTAPAPTPTPTATPTPEPPVPGKTVGVEPSGTVLVKLKGSKKFVPLKPGSLPLGAQIDATKGRVTITSIPRPGAALETATFYGGIFTIAQSGGITTLKLTGPAPSCGKARAAAGKKVKARRLWGDGKGHFRTAGRYAAATVRGTRWLVEDNCSGTLTRVVSGVVSVRDTVRGKTIVVRAGKRYLAKPRRR